MPAARALCVAGTSLLALALLASLAVVGRHRIAIHALGLAGPPPLLEAADEGPRTRWVDDYFTVEAIDSRTFAIGEPRYAGQTINYLLLGERRAVLFDAGPGLRDIRPVAASLSDLPVTFVPSHFHYDHIGNEITFERVAIVDLPYLRERAHDGQLSLNFDEHLGVAEGFDAPTLEVDEWLAPGATIDLGGRELVVLWTPGHTEDSISLLDRANGQLFSGDYLYEGPLYAFLPNSHLGDYLGSANALLDQLPEDVAIYGAHRSAPPGTPVLARSDVDDVRTALEAIREDRLAGEGLYPVRYPVNERISLLAEPGWLQRWGRDQSTDVRSNSE